MIAGEVFAALRYKTVRLALRLEHHRLVKDLARGFFILLEMIAAIGRTQNR